MSNEAQGTAVDLHQEQIKKLGDIMLNAFTSFGEIAFAFQETYGKILLEISAKIEPLIKRLNQLHEFGWDDEYKEIVQRCGKLGWSFVGDMDPGAPRNLIGMTDRQIDRYFYSIFTDSRSNYLNTVFERISEKCTCANPNSLKEAIQSFRARRYNATATLLFSIMDSLLIEITEANNANHWKITEKYKKYVSEKDMVFFYSICFSAFFHVEAMYNKSMYRNSAEPIMINRHGVMHGTSMRKVSRKDCVQLFNTLDALLLAARAIEQRKNRKAKEAIAGHETHTASQTV